MSDDIYFYGDDHHFNPKWLLLIPAIAIVGFLAYLVYDKFFTEDENEQVTEAPQQPREIEEPLPQKAELELASADSTLNVIDTVINDISVRLYIPPTGSKPQLVMGYEVIKDTANTMLCFAAADAGVSDKIVGAFVVDGEVVSTGLSKKGFCAIIDDTVTIGISENSPLFERAINDKGSFFRQRALVDSGRIVINEKRGIFMCRALCRKENQLFVVHSMDRCSLYDFSQLLQDLGVEYAISLQSAENAKGWYLNTDGHCELVGDWSSRKYPKSANYIIWSR